MHHVSFESLDLKLSVSKYQGTNRVDIIAIKVQSNPRRDKHLLVVENFFEFYPPRAERKFNQIGPFEDSDAALIPLHLLAPHPAACHDYLTLDGSKRFSSFKVSGLIVLLTVDRSTIPRL
jgi:hypothetical protein